jgi:hypothetical protein
MLIGPADSPECQRSGFGEHSPDHANTHLKCMFIHDISRLCMIHRCPHPEEK